MKYPLTMSRKQSVFKGSWGNVQLVFEGTHVPGARTGEAVAETGCKTSMILNCICANNIAF